MLFLQEEVIQLRDGIVLGTFVLLGGKVCIFAERDIHLRKRIIACKYMVGGKVL